MPTCQPRPTNLPRLLFRVAVSVALMCLFALAWYAGHAPAAHAAGVPYCPSPLLDERAPTGRTIHLNRTEGPVGTDLSVSTSGWHPGVAVALHFDARNPKTGELYTLMADFAKGTVAQDGTIALTSLNAPSYFCVDMASPDYTSYQFDQDGGTTAYFVLAASDGEVSAPVTFRYLPAPGVGLGGLGSFGEAKVGTTITVTGTGWEPREPLSLTLRSGDPRVTNPVVPFAAVTHATADAAGNFSAPYSLDARLRWNVGVDLAVEGTGARFGTLDEYANFSLTPAVQPTFRVDHMLVTPGMTITVSGEHWYPGDTFTVKYCDAQWWRDGWVDGPNCGKEVNPRLGVVKVDASGRIHATFTIPRNQPLGVIMVRINEGAPWLKLTQIAVRVVNHLPTWDDVHPRVAAFRNGIVGSLPFTVPGVTLLGALAMVGVRRWRARRATARAIRL
jgi:hypothetical protein